MKYRNFILPIILSSIFLLFSYASSRIPATDNQQKSWSLTAQYIDGLKATMYKLEEENYFDSLYSLEPKFHLALHDAPDSIQIKFRSCCMYYGFLLSRKLNDYWTSLQYYLMAHQYARDSVNLDDLSWFVENEIASIYTRLGDYEKSEYYAQLVETSLKHFQQYNLLSRLYTNKGINQLSSGNENGAIRYFKRGLHIADSLQYAAGIFSNSLGLAEIYLDLSQDSLASEYLDQAETRLPDLISDSRYLEKKSGLEAAFGKYYMHRHDHHKSITYYHAAIVSLYQQYKTRNHRDFAKLYAELSKAYLWFEQADSSQNCIDLGLQSLLPDYHGRFEDLDTVQLYKENSFIDLSEVQHALFIRSFFNSRDTTDLKKAIACVELGLYVNDRLRSHLIMDPSKLIAIRNNKRLTNSGIETLYALYSIHPASASLLKLRDLFTRSKSILYNEKIKLQASALQLTPAEKSTRDSIESAMLALLDKKYEEHAQFELINNKLIQLQEKQNAITARHADLVKQVINLDQYVEYVQTDTTLYAFSDFNGHQQILKMGSTKELGSLLNRLNQYISFKELSPDTLICRDLYQFLVAPLNIGKPEKLVVIPDGQVSLIPFELLQDATGEYLLYRTTISYEYQYKPYVLADSTITKPDYVFCLAPQYHAPAPVAMESSRGAMYELPFAKAEAKKIGQIIGSHVQYSEASDKAKCIAGIKRSRIFHYSGHAIIKPEAAYLALSDENEIAKQLTDEEISLMSNPMDMVVLSACETGLGKWEYGEGIRSLGRSFMESGAGAAIYSLWNVNDRSTATIMSSFYRYVKKGCAKDEALKMAKLDFLHNAKGPQAHPFHWAAFIAAGDMHPLEHPFPKWMLISGALLVLIPVIWYFIFRAKRNFSSF